MLTFILPLYSNSNIQLPET